MAYTVELLSLIEEFPESFAQPTDISTAGAEHQQMKALKSTDPEPTEATMSQAGGSWPGVEIPKGYELTLHQQISTFGWGTVDVFLRYGAQGLAFIWVTVGKSGTEVQSFCEAIARLTNRLLALGTPVPEVVRDLRGIRGGDSEGLGPHRFLGLVDLIGKALQDAPQNLNGIPCPSPSTAVAVQTLKQAEPSQTAHWIDLSDSSAIASICPECGAELQQVNGCSGGACVVCGYSSCS